MKISVIVQWSSLGKGIGELRAGWVTNWFVSPRLKGYQDMKLLTGSAPCKRVTWVTLLFIFTYALLNLLLHLICCDGYVLVLLS